MIKMIELRKEQYIVPGDRYMVSPRDRKEVVSGKVIASRKVRGDYAHADYSLTGIVKGTESGLLVLNPATIRSTYAVDLGQVYEVTIELEEVKIPIENIEDIIWVENVERDKN